MKSWKVYKIHMEDRENVFTVNVPAPTKKEALNYVAGNGDVIKVVEHDWYGFGQGIDTNTLADTLRACSYGQFEIDVITRTLVAVGLAR